VKAVEFKTRAKALEVKLKNKETYEAGFIDQAAPETDQGTAHLRRSPTTSNGKEQRDPQPAHVHQSPFVLFFGFWIFL